MEMLTWPMPEIKVIKRSRNLGHFCALPIAAKGIQWSGAKEWIKAMDAVEINKINNELCICASVSNPHC
jgi:hypothetical protein